MVSTCNRLAATELKQWVMRVDISHPMRSVKGERTVMRGFESTLVRRPLSRPPSRPVLGCAPVQYLASDGHERTDIRNKTKRLSPRSGSAAAVRNCSRSVRKGRVDSVNRFGPGAGRTSAGFAMFFWASHCLQGLECDSSPTSGTVFPIARGVFAFGVYSGWTRFPLTLVPSL